MAQHQSYDERRQQIIAGALRAFSEKGYLGTSNKEHGAEAPVESSSVTGSRFGANTTRIFGANPPTGEGVGEDRSAGNVDRS